MNFFSIFFFFIFSSLSFGKVTLTPLGVASVLIQDETTKILFDAPFTRPKISHWLGMAPFKSNKKLVPKVIEKFGLEKLNGIFISHSHFDHSIDAPLMSHLTGAILYCDPNSKIIANAYKEFVLKTEFVTDGVKVKLGNFQVTPIKIHHEKIMGLDFLPGEVPATFNFNFYDYKAGDTWMYLIEHPNGTVLIEHSEKSHFPELYKFKPDLKTIDVLFQGVSRNDKESLISGYLGVLAPKIFIPSHFDNFFAEFNFHQFELYPLSRFLESMEWLQGKAPKSKIVIPKLGEAIQVF